MQFDSNGLPKDNGATDHMDSARLVGMLGLFGYPNVTNALLSRYSDLGICYRYPFVDVANPASNNSNNVTRDQIICLAAGYFGRGWRARATEILIASERRSTLGVHRAQNIEADVVGSVKPWYNGADLMLPSDIGHLRLCAGFQATLLQRAWLVVEIVLHNLLTPMREPNQLMCKAKVAGDMYVSLVKRNKRWKDAVRGYWSGWRAEPELAEFFIDNF